MCRSSLFIAQRPGKNNSVAVLCGTVIDIKDCVITLENEWFYPVHKKTGTASVQCKFGHDIIQRMKLKIGTTIMTLVESNDELDIIFDGGEINKISLLKGINMRYTGSFHFSASEGRKDEEILCGTVCDEKTGYSLAAEVYWHRYIITYMQNKERIYKTVVEYNKSKQTESLLNKKVIVTATKVRENHSLTTKSVFLV